MHSLVNEDLWNLACDIAVEKTISELELKSADSKRQLKQKEVIEQLLDKLKIVTAQKIYHYFLENNLSESETGYLSSLFRADDHVFWYMDEDKKNQQLGIGTDDTDQENNRDSADRSSDQSDGNGSTEITETGGITPKPSRQQMENQWKDISEHMQMDLNTFSKQIGNQAGGLIQNLREVNREKYNYESFLSRFAVRGEVMKLDMDEFDYVFYTYGLKLYGNVPLIEPLEYKEVNRIKEFVIAIDTSGSTSGKLVQRFVQKTYNILKSTESFFTKINVHIVQCDEIIQQDAKITSQDEFDEYLKHMAILGHGGTDFRPVFEYVDLLCGSKEFTNLKGLIYFTDGWGHFPEKAPEYETAFVFVDDGYNNYDVPSWAIKLILQKEDI